MNLKASSKANWIDSIKGIAIMGIVLVHFGVFFSPVRGGSFVANGQRGVQIFFIISGYLSYYSLHRFEMKIKVINYKNILMWIKKKYIRLMPLFYCSLIISLLAYGLGNRYWLGSEKTVSVLNILSHIFFLHGLNPYYTDSIIGVEWYIGALVIMYWIVPVFYSKIKDLKSACILFAVSEIIFKIFEELSNLLTRNLSDQYIWENYIYNFCAVRQFPIFVLGIVLYFLVNSKLKIELNKTFTILIFICNIVVIFLFIEGIIPSNIDLWGIVFLFWIFSVYKLMPLIFVNDIFSFMGKHSYGIYLFHFLIIRLYRKLLTYFNFSIDSLFLYLLSFLVMLVCSTFVSIAIDKSLNKMITFVGKRFLCFKKMTKTKGNL